MKSQDIWFIFCTIVVCERLLFITSVCTKWTDNSCLMEQYWDGVSAACPLSALRRDERRWWDQNINTLTQIRAWLGTLLLYFSKLIRVYQFVITLRLYPFKRYEKQQFLATPVFYFFLETYSFSQSVSIQVCYNKSKWRCTSARKEVCKSKD